MEKEILIGGEPVTLTVRENGGVHHVEVGGRRHDVRFVSLPDGRALCIVDGRVVEWADVGLDGLRYVRTGGALRRLKVEDPRSLRRGAAGAGMAGGKAEIVAPMPGKVVNVLVELGQKVSANDGIVVLEAMKMENELRTPVDGIVVRLEASVGSPAEQGALIAVIDPGDDAS